MKTRSNLATKEDLSGVKIEIASKCGDLESEISSLRADMHRTAWLIGGGIVTAITILTRLLA